MPNEPPCRPGVLQRGMIAGGERNALSRARRPQGTTTPSGPRVPSHGARPREIEARKIVTVAGLIEDAAIERRIVRHGQAALKKRPHLLEKLWPSRSASEAVVVEAVDRRGSCVDRCLRAEILVEENLAALPIKDRQLHYFRVGAEACRLSIQNAHRFVEKAPVRGHRHLQSLPRGVRIPPNEAS